MNKKVTVLILSYNGKYLLDDSVSSYLANDYPNFEVVVIDNGSTDGTMEYVKNKWPEVFVLRTEKNLGYSGGFNLGLDYAFNKKGADYVLVTNNDVLADSRVIAELLKAAEKDPMTGFVTGKVYYYEHPDVLQSVGKEYCKRLWNGRHIGSREKDIGQYDIESERCFIDDIYTLVNKRVYKEVGSYDPGFFLQCEEWDWQARAKEKGYKIFYTPHAKIWHKESMTIGKQSALKSYYNARNPMLVILRYKSPEFFKRYFWHHLYSGVLLPSLRNIKYFHFKSAIFVWRGFFSGFYSALKSRRLTISHFF